MYENSFLPPPVNLDHIPTEDKDYKIKKLKDYKVQGFQQQNRAKDQ
jgi:hypothetical protein